MNFHILVDNNTHRSTYFFLNSVDIAIKKSWYSEELLIYWWAHLFLNGIFDKTERWKRVDRKIKPPLRCFSSVLLLLWPQCYRREYKP